MSSIPDGSEGSFVAVHKTKIRNGGVYATLCGEAGMRIMLSHRVTCKECLKIMYINTLLRDTRDIKEV